METVYVVVNGAQIPIPKLQYQDVQHLIISGVEGGLTDPLGQLVDWLWGQIQKALGGIKWLIDQIVGGVNWLKDQFSKIGDILKTIIGDAFKGLKDFFGGLFDKIAGGVNWLMDQFGKFGDLIRKAFSDAFDFFRKLIGDMADKIIGGINWIKDQFSKFGDMVRKALSDAFEGFKSFIRGMIDNIVAGMNMLKDGVSKLSGDITKLSSDLGAKIGKFGEDLINFFKGLPDKLRQFAEDVYKGISKAFGDAFKTVIDGFKEFGGRLSDFIKGMQAFFTDVFKGITEGLGEVGAALGGFVNAVFDVGNRIWNTLQSLGGSLVDALTALGKGFQDLFSNPLGWFTRNVIEPLATAFSMIGQWIWDALPDWIKDAITAIQNFFTQDLVNFFTKTLPDFFTNLWNGIRDFLSDPLGWINRNVITPLANALNAIGQWIWSALPDWMKDAITAVQRFFTQDLVNFFTKTLPDFFANLWAGIQDFLKDPLGWFQRNVITPLANALNAIGQWIWNALPDWFKDALTAVQRFFTQDLVNFFTKTLPDFFSGIWAGIQDFCKNPLGWIAARVSEAWNAFVEWTRPVWEPIHNFFKGIWDGITGFVDHVKNIAQGVVKFFTDDVAKFFGETLPKFFTEDIPKFFTETLPKFFTQDLPNWLLNAGKMILDGLQTIGDAIFNAFKFLLEIFYKGIKAVEEVVRSFGEPLVNQSMKDAKAFMERALKPGSPPPELRDFINTVINSQMQIIQTYGEKLKKHGPVGMEQLLVAGTIAGLFSVLYATAQTGGLLADLFHLFKNMQIRKLIKSVMDSMGGYFVMSSVSATFTFFTIHPLLRRFWGKTFRPYIPGPEFWVEALFRKSVDEKAFKEHMAELGYPDFIIEAYKDIRANLMTAKQAITLVGLGKWTMKDALENLRKAGWIGERGFPGPEEALLASLELPSLGNVMEMLWRNYIDEKEAVKLFIASGRNPDYIEKEMKTYYKMPGPSDLVTFVVRDVIEPDDFKALMRAQGYMTSDMIQEIVGHTVEMPLIGGGYGAGDWADAYWEAHWRLPTMEQVTEFFNRAVVGAVSIKGKVFKISEDEASKAVFAYATLHDYKPEPRKLTKYLRAATGLSQLPIADRDIVEALRYRVLTRIEQRFVRRWGLISEEDYKRLAQAEGIDPYIKIKTLDGTEINMIDALVNAEFLQDLLEERTAVRTQVINAFVQGFKIEVDIIDPLTKTPVKINTLDVEASCRMLRFRPEEANWLKAMALIRRTIELRQDAIKALIDDYVAGAISDDDFKSELATLIDDPEVRNAVISFTIRKKMRNKVKRMLTRLDRDIIREADTMLRLYEEGLATRDKAKEALDKLVQNDVITRHEADILLSISDMRRKRELVDYAIRALAKKVSRGEISPEEFISRITALGVDREFADAILEVYVPFHTLSISGLLSYADEVFIPPDVLEKKLKQLRVPPDEAEIIRAVAKKRPIMDEIRNLGYVLQTLSQNLEVTPGEATGILSALGLMPEEIQIRGKIFTSLYKYGLRKQIRRTLDVMLREQYQALAKGKDPKLITLDEYIRLYRAMGYPDEYIISRAQEIIASAAQLKLPQFKPEVMIK